MTDNRRQVVMAGVLLAAAALAGTAVLSATHRHSAPFIAENQRLRLLQQLSTVIPRNRYDNDLVNDAIAVRNPALLGTDEPVNVYRARQDGNPTAVALRVVAPDGYGGPIQLLVGVTATGELSGVRVIEHRETPGLGDGIEERRGDWIHCFDGRSRGSPPDGRWAVKRDGGVFDQFTGATVTPRAVVKAVHRALVFFAENRDTLLRPEPPPVAEPGREEG